MHMFRIAFRLVFMHTCSTLQLKGRCWAIRKSFDWIEATIYHVITGGYSWKCDLVRPVHQPIWGLTANVLHVFEVQCNSLEQLKPSIFIQTSSRINIVHPLVSDEDFCYFEYWNALLNDCLGRGPRRIVLPEVIPRAYNHLASHVIGNLWPDPGLICTCIWGAWNLWCVCKHSGAGGKVSVGVVANVMTMEFHKIGTGLAGGIVLTGSTPDIAMQVLQVVPGFPRSPIGWWPARANLLSHRPPFPHPRPTPLTHPLPLPPPVATDGDGCCLDSHIGNQTKRRAKTRNVTTHLPPFRSRLTHIRSSECVSFPSSFLSPLPCQTTNAYLTQQCLEITVHLGSQRISKTSRDG